MLTQNIEYFIGSPGMIDIHRCKFPRAVEENTCAQALRDMFSAARNTLPTVRLDSAMKTALQRALRTGRIRRGFETVLDVLDNERRGLAKLQKKTGQAQKGRISRLILASSDCSNRLRREIAETLKRNEPRVLALELQGDSASLGQLLYGPDAHVKVVLLDHKDTVADVLIAAAKQHSTA
jgi:hypothetical protein